MRTCCWPTLQPTVFARPGAGTTLLLCPVRFTLRACAILRQMQLSGLLLLDTKHKTTVLASIDKNWKMQGKDLLDATRKKLHYQKTPNGGLDVVQEAYPPRCSYLKLAMVPTAKAALYQSEALSSVDHEAIDNVVELLALGLVVKSEAEAGENPGTRLTLRSYFRAMEAAATELGTALMPSSREDSWTLFPPQRSASHSAHHLDG